MEYILPWLLRYCGNPTFVQLSSSLHHPKISILNIVNEGELTLENLLLPPIVDAFMRIVNIGKFLFGITIDCYLVSADREDT